MPFKIISDWQSVEDELDRCINAPSSTAIQELELTLAMGFSQIEAMVHVITGALRGSGKLSSSVDDGSHSWSGQMTWGGASPGFLPRATDHPSTHHIEHHPIEDEQERNEVIYAWFEMRRGGTHDYVGRAREVNDAAFAEAFSFGVGK